DRRSFGEVLPLLKKIKSLIIDARPLHAEDFCPTTKKPLGDPANPKGYDLTEINTRILTLRGRAETLLGGLRAVNLQTQITEPDGTVLLFSDLGDASDALDAHQLDFTDTVITFNDPDVLQLQDLLRQISLLGIADSFPLLGGSTTDTGKLTLLAQGRAVIHQLAKAVADAKASFDKIALAGGPEEKIGLYTASAKAILSGAFMLLPQFTYNNKDDIRQSHLAESDLLTFAGSNGMLFPVDEWLQSMSHARKKLERWDAVRSLDEVINGRSDQLHVVQLPFRVKDSWVAVSFPATYSGFDEKGNPADIPFTIAQDTLSVVIHGEAAFDTTKTQSGLLLDEWTEQVPATEEITGIGFNYDRPDAMPPQALLLAVTPAVTGNWSWEKLVGIVNDTFDRAKQRAVDTVSLDAVNSPQTSILLPAILSNFTQYDLGISLDLRLNVKDFAAKAPAMTAYQYKGNDN
ncbi:MAG: hypothetical protein KGO82_20140, partial [Bacteroidota bacterium]|nr:hypothetical protein [Bacteroidota bacterium]